MPETTNENLFTFDVKSILGVEFSTPQHSKLMQNLYHAQPKMTTNTKYLLFQHNTTGFKLGVSAFLLKQLKDNDFYVSTINQNGQREFEFDFHNLALFQISLESFFTYCGAVITSTCREIWSAYALNLRTDSVYFFNVKDALKQNHPNAQITHHFVDVNDKEWFKYLYGARNRVEHGQILMFEFRGDTGRVVIADKQNVDNDSITTDKRYEPAVWCQTIFDETCGFVDICFKDLNTRLYG